MTKPDLAAIRALHQKTTPGEWECHRYDLDGGDIHYQIQSTDAGGVVLHTERDSENRRARHDAAFIVAAHCDVPALCDRIAELEERAARAERVERAARALVASAEAPADGEMPNFVKRIRTIDELRAALDAAGGTDG